jgi:hypothetical protein
MAIVRHFGKPSLFITFTANPNRPEIHDLLHKDGHGLTAVDRPDLDAWVYNLMMEAFLNNLRNHHIFGCHMGHCYCIEY